MSKYLGLEKIYYKKDIDFEEEYKNRINNPCALKFDLKIIPINKGERKYNKEYQLFYLPLKEIVMLQDKIFLKSKEIQKLYYSLPFMARNRLIEDILLNEIEKSNEVEGVSTTKKELYEDMNSKKNKRFSGIINKYLKIAINDTKKIENVEEFREIYNDIFSKDILLDENNKLDGELFRKGGVKVQAKGGMKTVHIGDIDEKEIISHLEDLIEFMNSEVPFLVKLATVHYYLGYIHPFYDGNGRFARLLASMYIARKLDILSALSFSYAVFLNKSKYDKLFINMSSVKNMGELTFFILGILEILENGQQSIIDNIIFKKEKLLYAEEILEKENLTDNEKDILKVYLQNHIFSDVNKIRVNHIAKLLKNDNKWQSKDNIKTLIKKLEENGYLQKISSRPLIYTISEKFDI